MNALAVLSLVGAGAAAQVILDTPVYLVEVNSSLEGGSATLREMAALEDAVAAAYNSDDVLVETRRQRLAQTPANVHAHVQALAECANPQWSKARVLGCVRTLTFPSPLPKQLRFVRATHVMRISHQASPGGDLLVLSLAALGPEGRDHILQRQLPVGASPTLRRTVVLDMAADLLNTLTAGISAP
jgi:hypothetical protein